MGVFDNRNGLAVLMHMVKVIQEKKEYLSEVDGLIGDGDHGVNMSKGFTLFEKRFSNSDLTFTEGLYELGNLLFMEIGGSMGPIYGTIFMEMAEAGKQKGQFDTKGLALILDAGLKSLQELVEAKVGDKTLVDTLAPAVFSLKESAENRIPMQNALMKMKKAAEEGMNSTKDMAAKFGRSSRLGERSRGVLDAGAVSCCLLLHAMADGICENLNLEVSGE